MVRSPRLGLDLPDWVDPGGDPIDRSRSAPAVRSGPVPARPHPTGPTHTAGRRRHRHDLDHQAPTLLPGASTPRPRRHTDQPRRVTNTTPPRDPGPFAVTLCHRTPKPQSATETTLLHGIGQPVAVPSDSAQGERRRLYSHNSTDGSISGCAIRKSSYPMPAVPWKKLGL